MSTTATAERTTATAERTADQDAARRTSAYRRRIDLLRRRYRCRARRNTICANAVSLLLVAAGAGVGVTAMDPHDLGRATAVLGALVVLLEGVSRVLRPALRAGHARRTARALDRECRLHDARGRSYRTGGAAADAAFVDAVERILDHASAEEDRDDAEPGSDTTPVSPEQTGTRRSLRTVE
ncbi:MAG: hypothetical protein QOF00_2634 [Pseudonocardiales bacterium]|jgi:hypothetical protein|nr:hypothetical protein [Pseudonocardiales bacterium]